MLAVSVAAFVASLATCLGLIAIAPKLAFQKAALADTRARQASHVRPTPRVGGLSLAAAALAFLALFERGGFSDPSGLILVSALPIFLVGLKEDVSRNASPKVRYGAAILSALLAFWLLGLWIDRAAPFWLTAMLAFAPVGVAITVFTTASYAHAFNLIDGLNGLCAGTSVLISAGLIAVAMQSGQDGLVPLLLMMIGGLAGFLVWNFPAGKIFLGDAGAYTIGHVLSWIGVALIANSTQVSAWAIMLIFFWPLADTLFAIARRVGSGESIDTPDRMHFHQLVMRVLQLTILGRNRRELANPLATLALMPLIGGTVALGVVFWNDSRAAVLGLIGCGAAFVLGHARLRRLARRYRKPGTVEALKSKERKTAEKPVEKAA
ncbi:glycosyltransferase family 4 protein [Jhaorihella thermophila]|uniref:UDP-N-acetylmuramyl pentapeptide phosphotransferase/UDP-N-acetylglucosamine-1-phosphate transferase n=1 Tax=Jhaorihella thermophila TaxID=488547 RepID=A0A1H5YKR7_9RHOB|nr:UDP-N-acetylmuramyl pentapeptide phosphotransferase/UDP-N-acetylglucosamine-1-phosphate transferase [Jhaorihella thermophila]